MSKGWCVMSRFAKTKNKDGAISFVDIEWIVAVNDHANVIRLKDGRTLRCSDKGRRDIMRAIESSGLMQLGLGSQLVNAILMLLIVALMSFLVCQAASIEWTWMTGLGTWAACAIVRFAIGGARK